MRPQLNADQPTSVGAARVRTMKTFLAFICILLLVFALVGCSKQAPKESEKVAAPAAPIEQPPAEPAVSVETAPAAQPEPKPVEAAPAESRTSQLIGVWSLDKQLQWNPETSAWEPGIFLDDGSVTEVPPEPTIIEFVKGLDVDWCAGIETESGVEYVSMLPGGCWQVKGDVLKEVGMPPEVGIGSLSWEKKGENLEITIAYNDETNAELSRSKAVLGPMK